MGDPPPPPQSSGAEVLVFIIIGRSDDIRPLPRVRAHLRGGRLLGIIALLGTYQHQEYLLMCDNSVRAIKGR